MTVSNEIIFMEWFKGHTHDGGKAYESNTRKYYICALRTASREFSDLIHPYETIFDIKEKNEFIRVREIIESNEDAKKFIKVYGGGCLTRCFNIYQKYLEEFAIEEEKKPKIDILKQELTDNTLDNKKWIFLCLEKMKYFGVFDEDIISKLTNFEFCKSMFKMYFTPILTKELDEANAARVYPKDKFVLDEENEFFVSKEWFNNPVRNTKNQINRMLFTKWVLETIKEKTKKLVYKTNVTSNYPLNRIIFGAPGTGKSNLLKDEQKDLISNGGSFERVTFHPDYTYANFVGTYKPVPLQDDNGAEAITYQYVPGPFTRVLVKALQDPENAYLLLIEEINRANVAAVFGDVFQLLDRDKYGVSEYEIQTSEDMRNYLVEELNVEISEVDKIYLPNNLYLWATMNSADQGVYPMDTAFKRRWDFEYIDIDNNDNEINEFWFDVAGKQYHWNSLRKAINDQLTEIGINEDKLMGAFFVSKHIIDSVDNDKFVKAFCNKVIMYLFEDAARQKHSKIFDLGNGKVRYSKLCADFYKKGISVFVTDIVEKYEDFVKGVKLPLDKQPVEQIESMAE